MIAKDTLIDTMAGAAPPRPVSQRASRSGPGGSRACQLPCLRRRVALTPPPHWCSRARWSCWRRDGRLGWAAQRTIAPPYVVNGQCSCPDFATASGHLCTHRLAYGIAKRAAELLQACPTPLSAPQDRGAWVPSDALDDPSASAEGDPGDAEVPPEQRATAALPQETAPRAVPAADRRQALREICGPADDGACPGCSSSKPGSQG